MDLLNTLFLSTPWPTLRLGLHLTFFAVALYLLVMGFRMRHALTLPNLRKARGGFAIAVGVTGLIFIGILVNQATWQLSGTSRPDFVAFMQLHDRRQFNPAHWVNRGKILDHRGRVLALTRQSDAGAERYYPLGAAAAHVVGYADPRFGTSGMEAAANVRLNGGKPGSLMEWGELGRQVITGDKRIKGNDLVLTIDAELQQAAYDALEGKRGAVVMLDPRNGALRVLVSRPSFDPHRIQSSLFTGPDPEARLLNRATQGLYPPGSTFKVVLAADLLDAGGGGPLDCPADGYTTSGRYRKIRDHEYYSARRAGRTWRGHGRISLGTALVKSSNVYFAKIGVMRGHDAFERITNRFRFNSRIALTKGHSRRQFMHTGVIPRIEKRDQYGLAQASIGQGRIQTTPIQMALIAAAIANQGVAVRPRLVADEAPEALARFMRPESARKLAAMMRRVVSEGTARGIETKGLPIAGKTGTAQNPFGKTHSWFIGFAPAHRAKLAFAVLVEHGGYGSTVAAPIARDLLLLAKQRGL